MGLGVQPQQKNFTIYALIYFGTVFPAETDTKLLPTL